MNHSSNNCKIEILFYEPSSGFGGSSNFLANLINNLNRQKFHSVVAVKNWGPQFEKIKDAEFVRVKDYVEPEKMSHFSFLAFFIKNILPEIIAIFYMIKKRRINLVHINTNIISGTPAIFAAKLAGIPCICYIQQTKQLIKREKFIAKFVDQCVIQNSHCMALYGNHINKQKLNLIYLGVDLNRFNSPRQGCLRNEFKLDSSPIVGIVGRIVEGKGQKEFILAAKEIIKEKPETKFVIIGDAKGGDEFYLQEVKELVKKEDLTGSVIFTGWRNDIEDVISDLDILVQSSSTFPESFGLTITEAMALSKPVVATDIPGPSEVVIHGVTGFLVPPGNIQKLAEAILTLLNNRELSENFGKAARKRIEEYFNIIRIAKELEKLYKKTLKKGVK